MSRPKSSKCRRAFSLFLAAAYGAAPRPFKKRVLAGHPRVLTMHMAARRSRSRRARAEAPASAAETAGALRSNAIGKKKKATAVATAASEPLGTTIAVATLTDSARASPEKGAKRATSGGSAQGKARRRTAPAVASNNLSSSRSAVPEKRARREKPPAARVYVLTYFFSSLTIDKQTVLGVPFGWLGSAAAEWLGVPICHSNVQVQNPRDPSDVCEFGFEGGARRGTGVYQCSAGANPHLAFARQTRCYLGDTSLRHEEICAVLDEVRAEWSSDSYHLLTKNCNHFCDALIRKLVPGKKAPAYVNRGARVLCALPAPFPGALPRCVTKWLPSGGSWTAGAVCAMAERERRLAGVRDFAERRDWDGDSLESLEEAADDASLGKRARSETREGSARKKERLDLLAAHLKPVPLVGEHARSWAF